MKRLAALALAALFLGAPAGAGGSGWQTDFEKAAKKAKKAERPILVEFTKEDASKAVNKAVLFTAKFKTWAKKNVVLLSIDCGKKVNKKLTAQYADLQKKFEVSEYPTILLVTHEGKKIGDLEWKRDEKAEAWIAKAQEIVEAAGSAGTWLLDFDEAKKISKRTRKRILIDFNGSDW